MRVGSVTSTNSMSSVQALKAVSTDPKIKKIENEIANAKQQMQKISPNEELSDTEKRIDRKNLQKEISGLNAKLRQQQEAFRKSQNKEIRMAELREDQKLTKEEQPEDNIQTNGTPSDKADEKKLPASNQQEISPGTVILNNNDGTVIFKGKMNPDEKHSVDAEEKAADEIKENGVAEKEDKAINNDNSAESGLSDKKIYAIVSADSSIQQSNRLGSVISSTRDGIAILKAEMNLDEMRGVDTEKKQAELEKMTKKEQRAIAFQSFLLGEANNAMKSAAKTNMAGVNEKTQNNDNVKNNAAISALGVSQEKTQAAQQGFSIVFR